VPGRGLGIFIGKKTPRRTISDVGLSKSAVTAPTPNIAHTNLSSTAVAQQASTSSPPSSKAPRGPQARRWICLLEERGAANQVRGTWRDARSFSLVRRLPEWPCSELRRFASVTRLKHAVGV
jgi:hypothetical protein